MSSRSQNSRRRSISKVDGEQIANILKFIGAMAGAMLIMCLLGFIFAPKDPATVTVYLMVIIVNVIVVIAALVIPKIVLRRFKEVEDKEKHS